MSKYFNPRLLNAVIAGTGMRNPVRPHVILGSEDGGFVRGDLMDANAIQEFINQKISDLVNNAPEALDTLKELADAIQENGVADLVTKGQLEAALANKVDKVAGKGLSTNDYTDDDKAVIDSLRSIHIKPLDYLFSDGSISSHLLSGKTPIAICVAPASHFADGKARFMSLKVMSTESNAGSINYNLTEQLLWGTGNTNVSELTNYNKVITIKNDGTSNGTKSWGYLPVDNWKNCNYVYNDMKYYSYTSSYPYYCPSPFLADGVSKNDLYFTAGQMLFDTNGIGNTAILKTLGEDYLGAIACSNFAPGVCDGEWYLPAVGELGYVIYRCGAIKEKIDLALSINPECGRTLPQASSFMSSTQYSAADFAHVSTSGGGIGNASKASSLHNREVRAFLALPDVAGIEDKFISLEERVAALEAYHTT